MREPVCPRGTRRPVWPAGPIFFWFLLLAVPVVPLAAQTVQGRLLDAQSGQPVKAAEMCLLSGESGETVVKRGLTTDSGGFGFTAAAGRYRLRAERIGYATVTSPPFDLVASEPLEVELRVSVQAVPLAPLTVVSPRPLLLRSLRLVSNGFFIREERWGPKGLALGTFIDKEAIERRQPTKVTDLLRSIPGVIVEGASFGDRLVQTARMTSSVNLFRGYCAPMLYLDGHPIRLVDERGDKLVQVSTIDDWVTPSSIAGIEVYSKISKPGEFTDMGADPCGAIVIWTGFAGRRGEGARAARGEAPMPGERPLQDERTKAAQRLLEQADSTEDKVTAGALYRQALDAAHAAIAADSTNPLARLQAGRAALGAGEYREADGHLGVADRLWPLYQLEVRSRRDRAWIALQRQAAPLMGAGRYDEAIPIFEDANAIYRERPEVMLALGQLYGQKGEDDRALANLDSAALVIQDSATLASVDSATAADWRDRLDAVAVTRAEVLAHAGRYDESIAAYRKLLGKHPDDVGYKGDLARLLIHTGRNDEAARMCDEMLRDSTLTAGDLYRIGVNYYQMSDYANAVRGFSGAATRSPMDRDALEMWTRSLALDSTWTEVPPVAERWIALDPNNRDAYMLQARAVTRLGDRPRAQELVSAIQELKVTVDALKIARGRKGGATVTGTLTNEKLADGAQVTLTFTFYDGRGDAVGTQSRTVTMGAQGQARSFSVGFDSDAGVGGYGYALVAYPPPPQAFAFTFSTGRCVVAPRVAWRVARLNRSPGARK